MVEHPILPPSELAAWPRALPTVTGIAPPLRVAELPDDPVLLFQDGVRAAVAAGVPEPHAATLATVDSDCMPDARTLILKDADARGWAFAWVLWRVEGVPQAGSKWCLPTVRRARFRSCIGIVAVRDRKVPGSAASGAFSRVRDARRVRQRASRSSSSASASRSRRFGAFTGAGFPSTSSRCFTISVRMMYPMKMKPMMANRIHWIA